MSALLAALVVTVPALVVLWRVVRVLSHLSRRQFSSIATFDGFAIGYSLLGAATIGAVVDSWIGGGIDWHAFAFVLSSALLILFDRRSRR